MEGLGQIFVGAAVDTLDALAPAAARREDEDGKAPVIGAPFLEDREPVHAREPQIEHDGVIFLGIAAEPGILAVDDRVDDVAGAMQGQHDFAGDAGIVFDQQDLHSSNSMVMTSPDLASTSMSRTLPSASMISIS